MRQGHGRFSQNIRRLQAREPVIRPMNTNLPVIFSGDLNAVDTGTSFAGPKW
jgi:hypothetical protein